MSAGVEVLGGRAKPPRMCCQAWVLMVWPPSPEGEEELKVHRVSVVAASVL